MKSAELREVLSTLERGWIKGRLEAKDQAGQSCGALDAKATQFTLYAALLRHVADFEEELPFYREPRHTFFAVHPLLLKAGSTTTLSHRVLATGDRFTKLQALDFVQDLYREALAREQDLDVVFYVDEKEGRPLNASTT